MLIPAGSALHVSTYTVTLLGKYLCYALLALALDLAWGYLGILSLGHGAFFALGGYAMGMYLMREIGTRGAYGNANLPDFMVFLNWSELPWFWLGSEYFIWALVMMLFVPGLLAFVLGWLCFRSRVSGVYLSIITQAMTYALMLAFYRNEMGFGGNNGLTDFKDILGFSLTADTTRVALFAITGLTVLAVYGLLRSIMDSRLGKLVVAVRDAEIAPAKPVVKKGDCVLKGQLIAEAGGFVSSPIYSSVSGKVKGLEQRFNPTGSQVECIVVENDGEYKEVEYEPVKPMEEMTREEIITATKIPNSGDLTTKLEELESCGFIRKYNAFGMKKKNAIYQLMDCFTLFYFKFLKSEPTDEHFWTNQINTPAVNTWLGLAFERVCMEHVDQIKFKLGISGVLTEVNSWYCKSDPDNGIFGSQIDMLIARKDQVINLCEMKYSQSEYTITEKVDRSIRNKISDLRVVSGTKYAIYPTLITTYGVVENSYSQEMQSVVTMDDLFA